MGGSVIAISTSLNAIDSILVYFLAYCFHSKLENNYKFTSP